MSDKVKSTKNGSKTETKTFSSTGQLKAIQHTDNKTGKTHEHSVGRGGLLGTIGPFTGNKK